MSNKSSGGNKGPVTYRSAVSGHFVKPGYAKTHPSTTVKEHNQPKK